MLTAAGFPSDTVVERRALGIEAQNLDIFTRDADDRSGMGIDAIPALADRGIAIGGLLLDAPIFNCDRRTATMLYLASL